MASLTAAEWGHLRRCVPSPAAGDEPVGSVLAAGDGTPLAEDRNRLVTTGDRTQHPELALARWAAADMLVQERARLAWTDSCAAAVLHALEQQIVRTDPQR